MILAQSDPFTTADAITLGVASAGALTDVASLAIALSHFWLSGARIRVAVTAGWLGPSGRRAFGTKTWDNSDARIVGTPAIQTVAVTASNRGRLATTIYAWGIVVGKEMEWSRPGMSPNSTLPVRIEPGESETFVVPLQDVIASHFAASVAMGQRSSKVYGRIRLGDGRDLRSRKPLVIPRF